MLRPSSIRVALRDRNLSYVSEQSDVAYPHVIKLSKGQHEKMTMETMAKISAYLEMTGFHDGLAVVNANQVNPL